MQPPKMDSFSAKYTSTPFVAVDAHDTRGYATEKQMRRDSRNRGAALFVINRGTAEWISLPKEG
jgi:hypothetical protein